MATGQLDCEHHGILKAPNPQPCCLDALLFRPTVVVILDRLIPL